MGLERPQQLDVFKEQGPQISTGAFLKELQRIDFSSDPSPRVFRGVNFNAAQFIKGCPKNNLVIVPSSDGLISNVIESPDKKLDNSHSSGFFDFHTDGQYLEKVPEIVVLHCKEEGSKKIPTSFADSRGIIQVLRERGEIAYAQQFDFIFKNKHGIEFRRPLFEAHSKTGELVMNVALGSTRCRLEPKKGSGKSKADADRLYGYLSQIANEVPAVTFVWQKGDTIVFDNQRLLHARGKLANEETQDAARRLYRIWLNKKSHG